MMVRPSLCVSHEQTRFVTFALRCAHPPPSGSKITPTMAHGTQSKDPACPPHQSRKHHTLSDSDSSRIRSVRSMWWSHRVICALVFGFALLVGLTDGFVVSSSSSSSSSIHRQNAFTAANDCTSQDIPITRRLLSGRLALSLSMIKQPKDTTETPTKRTRIEDGSPLGVAIVVLGGSLVVLLGNNDETPNRSLLWAVFATASIAAGISRLVKNQTKH